MAIMNKFTTIEICAGAGGQALGLEMAGFKHLALVEIDRHACNTLKTNRPGWNVIEEDINKFNGQSYKGVDLVAGGVPCPPFSMAGKQLGDEDDRDLFPAALKLVEQCQPKAVMLENVRGLLSPKFDDYRKQINQQLEKMGYKVSWRLLHASDFGVPQLRPRAVLIALRPEFAEHFEWPENNIGKYITVGEALFKEMASAGWKLASEWKKQANSIAPTLVGGSKKHGGPDLGPTRAKQAWAKLGVDAYGLADNPPPVDFQGVPKLTPEMTALIQGFPREWTITGKKTSAYRQIGNAFPPPVARAVGISIYQSLASAAKTAAPQVETPGEKSIFTSSSEAHAV